MSSVWTSILEFARNYLRPGSAVAVSGFATGMVILLLSAYVTEPHRLAAFLDNIVGPTFVITVFLGFYLAYTVLELSVARLARWLRPKWEHLQKSRSLGKELTDLPDKERLLIMAFAEQATNNLESLPNPEDAVLRARGIVEWGLYTSRVYLRERYWQWLMLNRDNFIAKNRHLKDKFPEIQRRIRY